MSDNRFSVGLSIAFQSVPTNFLSKAMKYSAAVHLYFDTQGISTYKFGCLGNEIERQQQQQKRK